MNNDITLHELGIKYSTDKAHTHGFTHLYGEKLSAFKYDNLKILEIGVWMGCSLKMWEEYFVNSQIFGADIFTEEERKKETINYNSKLQPENHVNIIFDENRTKIFVVNQEIEEDLLKLPDDLDIIIDDGGHTMFQQQLTLKVMINKLKTNGIYILEDLHTSFLDSYGANDKNNTIKLLNDIKNKQISPDNQFFINEKDFYDICNVVTSVEIFQMSNGSVTSIIKK